MTCQLCQNWHGTIISIYIRLTPASQTYQHSQYPYLLYIFYHHFWIQHLPFLPVHFYYHLFHFLLGTLDFKWTLLKWQYNCDFFHIWNNFLEIYFRCCKLYLYVEDCIYGILQWYFNYNISKSICTQHCFDGWHISFTDLEYS